MRIGITYDLKDDVADSALLPAFVSALDGAASSLPDDLQEEFDSPVTIEAIAGVLRRLGHEVDTLGDGPGMLARLLADPPDFVFNFAEGHGIARSREARVPAVLEMLGIPHSGSDPLTLAATLDKDCARRLVASEGVPVPAGFVIGPDDDKVFSSEKVLATYLQDRRVPLPVILKPVWEGSSKGIRKKCLVERLEDFPSVVRSLWADYRQPVLVEEFIQGDELTVGVVGNDPPRIIGVMRVLPTEPTSRFVYSLEIKRDFRRLVRYEVPAALPASTLRRVEELTLTAYRALGCRDVSRVDFRLRDGVPYFLEVNPLPGLNPESSDLVILANLAGWTYDQLIEAIVRAALERCRRAGFAFAVPKGVLG
jgi:D-alanine-D-alanine ligase